MTLKPFPVDRSLAELPERHSTLSLAMPLGATLIQSRPMGDVIAFAALFVCARMLDLGRICARRSSNSVAPEGDFIEVEYAQDLSLGRAFATLHRGEASGSNDVDLVIVEPGGRSFGADVELSFETVDGGLRLTLDFDSSQVALASARDFIEKIALVAEALATTPDLLCSGLELVTDAAGAFIPDLTREITARQYVPVPEVFLRRASEHADQPALIGANRSYSYAELARVVRFLAFCLIEGGVRPGDVVVVSGLMSFGMIAATIATMAAGGVVVTLDHALPDLRQKSIVDISRPRLQIRVAPTQHIFDAATAGLVMADWPDHAPIAALPDADLRLPRLPADSAAYVFFTSGSTGAPKGVLGTHLGLAHFLDWQRASFPIGPGDRAAQITALSFDVVLRDILFPLTSGAALYFPERGMLLDARRMLHWISDRAITVMHCVPSLMRAWLHAAADQRPFRSLKYVFFAGEPLTDGLLRQFVRAAGEGTQIVNLYGPTETTLAKLANRVERIEPGVQPVGAPQPGVDVAIVRERRFLCGLWEIGEIAIRTPYRSKGYLGNEDLTRQAFLPNRFTDNPTDLIYYTGDLGRYRSDGKIEIFGRIDAQIKIRGVRIEPNEIESQIQSLPQVGDAAVTVRLGANDEKTLFGLVAPNGPLGADRHVDFARAIREALQERLSEAMIPSRIVVVDGLPYLPNGKLDRKTIAALDLKGSRATLPDARRKQDLDQRTRALIEGIESAAGIHVDSLDKSFVELGGDLLSYVRVSMLIEDLLGELPSDWERKPLAEFNKLWPTEIATRASAWSWGSFEITMLMRAVSIALVVLTYTGTLTFLAGATSSLFVVSGMNFSRFLRPAIRKTSSIRPAVILILKFGIPAGLWQLAITVTHGFWLPNLFLLGTSFQNPKHPFYTFWYLDVLAANLLLLALITKAELRLRGGRSEIADAREDFGRALVFVLLGLCIAVAQVTTGFWDGNVGTDSVGPFKWFWMLALGLLITEADTSARKLTVCGLLAAIALSTYAGPREIAHVFKYNDAFFFGSALLLTWVESLPVPRFLHRPLVAIASSTLFIYIVHNSFIKRMPMLHLPAYWPFQLVVSVAAGIVCTVIWNKVASYVTRRRAFARPGEGAPASASVL